jgi:hypothetical protein
MRDERGRGAGAGVGAGLEAGVGARRVGMVRSELGEGEGERPRRGVRGKVGGGRGGAMGGGQGWSLAGVGRRSAATNDGPRPFGLTTVARMGPEGVFVGTGDAYEIEVFREDGGSFTFGRPDGRQALTREMLEAWLESPLSRQAPQDRTMSSQIREGVGLPEMLPAYSDFLFDELGLLWVGTFPPPARPWARWDVWEISDSEAAHIASLEIPTALRPLEMGEDYLMGVHTDDLGVERVHRY